jgi:hypothetical protein
VLAVVSSKLTSYQSLGQPVCTDQNNKAVVYFAIIFYFSSRSNSTLSDIPTKKACSALAAVSRLLFSLSQLMCDIAQVLKRNSKPNGLFEHYVKGKLSLPSETTG